MDMTYTMTMYKIQQYCNTYSYCRIWWLSYNMLYHLVHVTQFLNYVKHQHYNCCLSIQIYRMIIHSCLINSVTWQYDDTVHWQHWLRIISYSKMSTYTITCHYSYVIVYVDILKEMYLACEKSEPCVVWRILGEW
jgi:hypothetical protein